MTLKMVAWLLIIVPLEYARVHQIVTLVYQIWIVKLDYTAHLLEILLIPPMELTQQTQLGFALPKFKKELNAFTISCAKTAKDAGMEFVLISSH